MFGTIRKHQTWLWVIIIIVVVIAFVIYFNPSTRQGQGGPMRSENFGTIAGETITRDKFADANREVYLMFFTRYGDWPDKEAQRTGFNEVRETFYRLLLLKKARELNIHVSDTVVAQLAREILRAFEQAGAGTLAEFEQRILAPRGMQRKDFERFVRNEVAIQELASLIGGSGRLVTPEEARETYAREYEELSTQMVVLSATNYLPAISVSAESVAQFYTNQMPRYRLPERVQVSVVAFPASNHLAAAEAELSATNLNEIVEANLQRLGTNYVRIAPTLDAAKTKIREQIIHRDALNKARRAAYDFATVLFDQEPLQAGNLRALAQARELPVQALAPFDRERGPLDLDVGLNFVQAAFKLSADTPFSSPVVEEDAVYILALDRRVPSEVPPFESVRDRVTADWRYEQAVQQARQAGQAFQATLTNGLAAGKSFTELCTAAKLKPVFLPPVSLATRSVAEIERDLPLSQFKQVAFNTPVGQASDLIFTRHGGVIIQVQSRLPLDEAKMKTDLPAFTATLRQIRQNDAFNEWFRKQAEEGLRTTALAQMQAAEGPGGAAPQ